MISQLTSHTALLIVETLKYYLGWGLYLIPVLLALLAWRVWNFTLRPLMKPDELHHLPYWVPCKLSNTPRLQYLEVFWLRFLLKVSAVIGMHPFARALSRARRSNVCFILVQVTH